MRRFGRRRRPPRDERGIIVLSDVSAPPDALPPSAAIATPLGDLPPIERIQAMSVEPGDVIVVKVPARGPQDFADLREQITALMDEKFPGHKVLVTAGDIEVSVMRPQQNLTIGPLEIRKADETELTPEDAQRIVQGFRDALADRGIITDARIA